MIKGMTGFGSAELAIKNLKGIIEIKSVNHRYFDLNCYFPNGFGSAENKIKQALQKNIKRGRVSVSIKITQKPEQTVSMNHEVIKQYTRQAKSLEKIFHIKNNLSLADIIQLPGVVETKETFVDIEKKWALVDKSLKKALASVVMMRKREGKSLSVDISSQLKNMIVQIKKIQSRIKVIIREKKKKLKGDEFSSYQKSSDINEEISRLNHYVFETKKMLQSTTPIGKKIDFIAQEMQRETNTIGSKQQDKLVANAVITLKSKIEKIREQAQNVE